jgi:hypothetical protein
MLAHVDARSLRKRKFEIGMALPAHRSGSRAEGRSRN